MWMIQNNQKPVVLDPRMYQYSIFINLIYLQIICPLNLFLLKNEKYLHSASVYTNTDKGKDMKAFLIIIFFIQTGISFGLFPELNFSFPIPNEETQGRLLDYRNILMNNIEKAVDECGHLNKTDERQMKMIIRLKRMSKCSGRESRK